MASIIKYGVDVDASQIQSRFAEIRSQLNGLFGSPQSDFAGAVTGLTQFAGAATASYATMRQGLSQIGGSIQTFTNPAMSLQPHYGMIQAESSLNQEWTAMRYGPAAMAQMTPPGVSAVEYTQALSKNFSNRMQEATFGALGAMAPVAASFAAWRPGSAIGSGLAKLAGFGAIGGMVGAAVGGMGLGMVAEKFVGDAIEHGEKVFAETKELGQLATAGRNFSMAETFEFGRGFRKMASNMGVSTSEVGDIVAGIRQAGMMPRTKDVKGALQQFEDMARDIREVAVGMQTSLSRATGYLRDVERLGLGRGAGGVMGAAQMAENLGTSLGGLISYVGQGRQVGMATGLGGGTGSQLFLQSAFGGAQGMGALTGEERLMVGGATGLGRAFAMNAMQNAMGPWGEIQGMAMMGPTGAKALPGTMMGTVGQAFGNIFGGGDPIANFVEFQTNRKRMLNQMGGRGMRLMQAQGIQSQAQMLMQISPGMDQQGALQFVAQQQGMNEHQARAMAGFIMRGFRDRGPSRQVEGLPGVFGGGRIAAGAIQAAQENLVRTTVAETEKTTWQQGIEAVGNVWARWRESGALAAEQRRKARMDELGIPEVSEEAVGEVTKFMRTGRGALSVVGDVDISGMGAAGGQLQAAALLSGVDVDGKTLDPNDLRSGLRGLARNIQRSDRLSGKDESRIATMAHKVADADARKTLNVKAEAETIRAARAQMSKGGEGAYVASRRLTGAYEGIIRAGGGMELLEEFQKEGFSGDRGAQMMRLIDKTMSYAGMEGQSTARHLRSATTTGMAALAGGVEKIASDLVREVSGSTEEWEKQQVRKAAIDAAWRARGGSREDVSEEEIRWQTYEGGIRESVLREIKEGVRKSPRISHEDAKRIVESKEVAEAARLRDEIFFEPFRRARQIVRRRPDFKKLSAEKRAALVEKKGKELRQKAKDSKMKEYEAAKQRAIDLRKDKKSTNNKETLAAIKQVINDDGDMKKILAMKDMNDAKRKSRRQKRRGPRGRRVAFQNQAEGFQGKVTQMLNKTARTLAQVKGAMESMEGRLKESK